MGFLKDKTKITPGLLPEQQQALDMLMGTASAGQVPYGGDFSIKTPALDDIISRYQKGQILPEQYMGAFDTLLNQGPVSTTEAAKAQRAVAERAADQAANSIFAQAAKGGGRYSSSAVAAGVGAAADVKSKTEAEILNQVMQAEAADRARKAQLLSLAGQLYQGMQAGVIDASKIQAANEQWKQGMTYEEFKRMHPDIYQLLLSVWGRNVDFMAQKQPSMFSTILGTVGQIADIVSTLGGKPFSRKTPSTQIFNPEGVMG